MVKVAESDQLEVAPNGFYRPRGSMLTLPDGRTVLFFGGADYTDKNSRINRESWFYKEIPAAANFEKLDRLNSNYLHYNFLITLIVMRKL